jgi:outer membrane lipoprotein-sorting protein
MMQNRFILTLLAVMTVVSTGESHTASHVPDAPASDVNVVLAKMDKAGQGLRFAHADFKCETFTAAGQGPETETGRITFYRNGKDQEVDIRVVSPQPRHMVIKNYQVTGSDPKVNQKTENKPGGCDTDSILNAFPFGIRAEDLEKDYQATLGERETIDKVQTAKLEAVPRQEKTRKLCDKIILWVDPEHGVALQQKRVESSGNYQLAHYSNIVLDELTSVLAQMDKAGKGFKSAKAEYKLEQYTAVVNETEVQSGQIFFRRKGKNQEVAIQIETPHPKQVVIRNNQATLYDPRLKQTSEHRIDPSDAQSIMNAFAFGAKGQDLRQDYEVTFSGWETVDDVRTARLELMARNEKLRRFFSKVILWIDLERDVAIQQKRLEPSGDYMFTHYRKIVLDGEIPDGVFTIRK